MSPPNSDSHLGVVGDDGLPYPPGVAPGMLPPPTLAPATPDDVTCLRGPCRHFWQIQTNIEYGNPQDTFKELGIDEPRLVTARCTIQSGVDFDMAEVDVYECNQWDPKDSQELVQISRRRRDYFKKHPEHDPTHDSTQKSWWTRTMEKIKAWLR